jgi:hypothetical protein
MPMILSAIVSGSKWDVRAHPTFLVVFRTCAYCAYEQPLTTPGTGSGLKVALSHRIPLLDQR